MYAKILCGQDWYLCRVSGHMPVSFISCHGMTEAVALRTRRSSSLPGVLGIREGPPPCGPRW